MARSLKSPLLGCDDADLLWLAIRARAGSLAWLPCLLEATDVPDSALRRAQSLWRGWVEAARELTPFELVERVVSDSDAMGRVLATVPVSRRAAAIDAVQAVATAALDQRGGRFATLHGFVRELKSGAAKITSQAPADAVQLLTVHGAKGLEAEVVFIADTDPEMRRSDSATLLVDWPVECEAPRLAAFVASEKHLPPSLRELLDEETLAREREELNGLYVAMTRARQHLVLSCIQPHKPGPARSWWDRVTALAAPPLLAVAGADVAARAAPDRVWVTHLPALLPRGHVPPPATAHDGARARLGQALHRWLEWAARPGVAADAWPALASAASAGFGLGAEEAEEILASGKAVLGSRSCRAFFDAAQLRWAGNEVALAWQGKVLRVDRLVQLEADGQVAWWVLDYKLHAAAREVGAYRGQLAEYVLAVQALVPGERVLGAFISAGGTLAPL